MDYTCPDCKRHHTRCQCTINVRREFLELPPLTLDEHNIDGELTLIEYIRQYLLRFTC